MRTCLNTPGLCTLLLFDWLTNIQTFLSNSGDVDYANAWLLSHSGNSIPPDTINPTAALAAGDFRLFNRLQAKYYLQSSGRVTTPIIL